MAPAEQWLGHVLLLPCLPQGHTCPPPTSDTATCCQGPGVALGAVGAQGAAGAGVGGLFRDGVETGQLASAPLVKTRSLTSLGLTRLLEKMGVLKKKPFGGSCQLCHGAPWMSGEVYLSQKLRTRKARPQRGRGEGAEDPPSAGPCVLKRY